VTVVLPCYNEELILPYTANTLRSVESRLGDTFDLRFLFVDDRSTDGTWEAMQRIFGERPNCTLVRHAENRGIAGAIMTGLRNAETEIVCSMDADCSYDPHELARMIPLLTDEVDLVTASPYHPLGGVRNVPHWRIVLSRSLSHIYKLVLRHKLKTYTSCFRVYRRSAALSVHLKRTGFLGISEFIGKLDLAGGGIVEYPTVLEVRVMGRSKMKIVRTILGQLRLVSEFVMLRATGGVPPLASRAAAPSPARTESSRAIA
jgi:glycosyltransferase involved in cell wall biosynthesis